MITCQILLIQNPCSDDSRKRTVDSLSFAGALPEMITNCLPEQIAAIIEASSSEVIHLIQPGTIVLPDFYQAMLSTLEHTGKDFVVCIDGLLSRREKIRAGEKDFNSAQVIVRRWVYQEIGVGNESPDTVIAKVLGEYRGCEVPHMLTMRL